MSAHSTWPAPRPAHDPATVGLLAVDVDGTIVDGWPERISQRVIDAMQRAAADPRLHLVFATGRAAYSTLRIARAFGIFRSWAVCSNGSLTVRFDPDLPDGFEITNQVTFDPGPALDAVLHLLPAGTSVAVEEVGVGFLATKQFPEGELDGQVTVVSLEELATRPATRVILRSTDLTQELMAQVMEATRLGGVTYAVGWTGWVDLNPPGVSKASALEALRQRLGVAASGTVALGDGGNDLAMLSWASRGVAMGGSAQSVIAAAGEVTGSVEDDGAAWLIDDVLAGLPN